MSLGPDTAEASALEKDRALSARRSAEVRVEKRFEADFARRAVSAKRGS